MQCGVLRKPFRGSCLDAFSNSIVERHANDSRVNPVGLARMALAQFRGSNVTK